MALKRFIPDGNNRMTVDGIGDRNRSKAAVEIGDDCIAVFIGVVLIHRGSHNRRQAAVVIL